ncbi:membrane protein insertase YidC [Enterococcus diestrammenae]|uniref:Membrane protein insertase YidC n=1 Tax=Enterococcus diestrammenae TaxID=1155073 RepID=A0ABV0F518_9ENTE|nr:membrane protein insertase YidC [Enterococcus diestrammenae]KAF1300335.1 OxaA precursor [Enterococcus diestrammenae]
MKKMKNWLLGSGLTLMLLFLSGCVKMTQDASGKAIPDTGSFTYKVLVAPLDSLLKMIANLVGGDNRWGWAIILVTLIVRFIILPLGIHQSRQTMIQSEKMQYIKPQLDAVQAKLKAATTQQEQLAAQQEMSAVYKENGVSMLGGMGCLPLLIQMPVFSALYTTARYSENLQNASFYGIDLTKPAIIFVVLAGVFYALQSIVSMVGIPEEQKKQMRMMSIVSPLMIIMFSIGAPAGVTLYWVVGGFIACLQTYITNVIMKPRIKVQIQEEMKKNPPKVVVTPPKKEVEAKSTTQANQPQAKKLNQGNNQNKGRNAGKQQRNHK